MFAQVSRGSREAARAAGATHGVAVRWKSSLGDRGKRLGWNSEDIARDLARQMSLIKGGLALYSVEAGGDEWDNPPISVVWCNSSDFAAKIAARFEGSQILVLEV